MFTVIILAISSRIYVEAAVAAGYTVIAIDAFADVDTQRLAKSSYRVDLDGGQLHRQQVITLLASLDLTEVIGICYGAGVEAQPDLLAELENYLPLLGNTAAIVKHCKAPDAFFSMCRSLDIPTPDTSLKQPENLAGWLQKKVGGSGGAHIAAADQLEHNKDSYYQRFQAGDSFSCLFLAAHEFVQIVGYNEQWVDENIVGAYCYGGAASHTEVVAEIKQQVPAYLQKICQQFELKGINSCDFIYNAGTVYVLEVNPRLSASLDLYQNQQAVLLQAHIDVFKKGLSKPLQLPLTSSKAHQVVYAKSACVIDKAQYWPAWASDIPPANTKVTAGAPVCTVNAVAANATAAKALLQQRLATFNF